jgi:uncharacterized Fe-S center protein
MVAKCKIAVASHAPVQRPLICSYGLRPDAKVEVAVTGYALMQKFKVAVAGYAPMQGLVKLFVNIT